MVAQPNVDPAELAKFSDLLPAAGGTQTANLNHYTKSIPSGLTG